MSFELKDIVDICAEVDLICRNRTLLIQSKKKKPLVVQELKASMFEN